MTDTRGADHEVSGKTNCLSVETRTIRSPALEECFSPTSAREGRGADSCSRDKEHRE